MADVYSQVKRTYIGLDADKTNVLALAGDHYYANDTFIDYTHDGTYWRGGFQYIKREPNAWDKTLVDFTTDGAWKVNGLDLSAIVPAGAVAVNLVVNILDDAANSNLNIRSDAGKGINSMSRTTQVANISIDGTGIIGIESDRLLDYVATNLVWTGINLAVLGWYI